MTPTVTMVLGLLCVAVVVPPVSLAAEPPACTDKQIQSRVKQAYNGSLMVEGGKRSFKSATLKEAGIGAPPAGVNQYTPSKDHYNKSRYCEAAILLDNGDKDQGFVRIDGLKDPNEKEFNFDLCTVKFDTFKDGCKDNKKP
jgi:hypothetical protein